MSFPQATRSAPELRFVPVLALLVAVLVNLPARGQAEHPVASTFRDCNSECPEMVVIPRGSFLMGSPSQEKGRQSEMEDPRHRVVIGYDLAVGKFEVTRDEYARFVHTTGRADPAGCNIHQPPRWPTV